MDFRLQAFAPGAMFAGYRVESLIGRGDFRFDRYGHITLAKITIFRVTGSTPSNRRLPSFLQGTVVDDVVTVPRRLAG